MVAVAAGEEESELSDWSVKAGGRGRARRRGKTRRRRKEPPPQAPGSSGGGGQGIRLSRSSLLNAFRRALGPARLRGCFASTLRPHFVRPFRRAALPAAPLQARLVHRLVPPLRTRPLTSPGNG
uniref:Uncharacterized protein n=1 Tax=Micrurus spixii TaxID=129469 RepID=A0A2D4LKH4_9SAUR